ncbi:response regulator transcription factor [Belnapia sp. T6]|uniref:Response regulator transcription factor n=1 Tax=Belnapia mucosa TaxID=2804532 RepID=A0ABS1V7Q6_9PROT|nr:response regulator transcription factor [Belnapia mucosa]MBL6457685.1 response regulator transcription factor [Belnapia mucosa]
MGQLGIIEADAILGHRMVGFFGENGFSAELHEDARSLLTQLPNRPPRVVLLGKGRESLTALQVLRRIRDLSLVPCILLADRGDELSEIMVLEAGADDLVGRDMPLPALLARIRAVLRRAEWGTVQADPAVAVGGWRLLPQRRELFRPDGSECVLTTAEFDLMSMLVENRGKAVSRDAIAETVFRRPFRAEDRTVDNLVLRLRRKLGPAQQDSIKTVRGSGYLFAGFADCGLRVA